MAKVRVYCPICKSRKPMKKKGKAFNGEGEKKQRWVCCSRKCPVFTQEGHHFMTIHPLRSKP